jgi:hypothetical protein
VRTRDVLLVFAIAAIVYNLNGRFVGSPDSMGARLLPIAFLTGGEAHLDRFDTLLPANPGYRYWLTPSRDGHLVSIYPIVVPTAVTPLFVPAALLFASGRLPPGEFWLITELSEKIAASLIAAASTAVMFALLRQVASFRTTVLLTGTYAFASQTWVIGSQALWQHGFAELLLAGMMLALLRGSPSAIGLTAVLCGLMTANRPPNVFFSAAAALYVLLHHRRQLPLFLALAAASAAPFVAYSMHAFDHALGGYSTFLGRQPIFRFTPTDWLHGLAALVLSPKKGLLLFAPFFAFLPASLGAPTPAALRRLLRCFAPAAALQLLFYGSFVFWWGGWCYGPRYLTDMTPVLILALVPGVEALRAPLARALFIALVAFGVGVQAIGAFCYPMGLSDANDDVWALDNIAYVTEAKAGLAPRTPYLAALR